MIKYWKRGIESIVEFPVHPPILKVGSYCGSFSDLVFSSALHLVYYSDYSVYIGLYRSSDEKT